MAGTAMGIDAEATHAKVRPAPGAVFARLVRQAEDGRTLRCMFVELTPGEALRFAEELVECARIAIDCALPSAAPYPAAASSAWIGAAPGRAERRQGPPPPPVSGRAANS